MLIFDQLRKNDSQLRWVAGIVLLGMLALLGGLWQVQVVSSRKYVETLKDQSFRNVLIPAPRGKVVDRAGRILAENQPRFVINLYLEDLRGRFTKEYTNVVRKEFIAAHPNVKLTAAMKAEMNQQARYRVVSNIVWEVSSTVLPQPLILNDKLFTRHYNDSLALPFEILKDLTPQQVAVFEEKGSRIPGVELEALPMRVYPNRSTAVHVLGFVRLEAPISDEEGIVFQDKTPVLVGKTGVEANFDEELRGRPGIKSILVNNLGYRQREEVWSPPLAGQNVTLTVDLEIQRAAEEALLKAGPMTGPEVRGAAVVMDVRNGDILAIASSPTFDPNMFLGSVSMEVYSQMTNEVLRPQLNRAYYGSYAPGSTFKIITGLAALEGGVMNPNDELYSPGYFQLGARKIKDTAAEGRYNLKEAFKHSSNTYFIYYGLRAGVQRLLEMGNRFGLGDRTGVVGGRQEVSGYFPEVGQRFKKDGSQWMEGDTANLCIGQGEITVTPLQMAVMTSAVANGGFVFKPRLVAKVDGGEADLPEKTFPTAQLVNEVKLNPQNLRIMQQAMLADVLEVGGSGRPAFVPGFNVCGKTGTAQVRRPHSQGGGMDHITWFVSYAPFEAPRYAVVVMVEGGPSGGTACAPKAGYIYSALQKIEQRSPLRVAGLPAGGVAQ
jgi:penicillin-binding protein 2